MFKNREKILLLFIIMGLILISSNTAFAQSIDGSDISIDDNQLVPIDNIINDDILDDDTEDYQIKENVYGNDNANEEIIQNDNADYNRIEDDNSNHNPKEHNIQGNNEILSSTDKKTILIVSDNPGTNILDASSKELYEEYDLSNVNLVVRSGIQVKEMNESEFASLLENCDAFIGEWISTDVDAVLTSILNKNPTLSDKELFLILEPPVGNLNSGSSSIELIRHSTLNHEKIFSSVSNEDLITYFQSTKRGTSYEDVVEAIREYGTDFNPIFNKMVLYKDIHDKENLKNQILFALNHLGLDIGYAEPSFASTQLYGIYRDRWYTLDDYIAEFFNPNNNRTIGILESTMYVSSQQLHPCNEIMEYFESNGYNVIPVFAAGATPEQLKVMVESFTSAGTDVTGFLSNSSNYEIYVNAIISVVAYGVGGENFTDTTKFFEEAGVPVFRAVHSDYVSNEQWELGTTCVTSEKSDKWWHVAIAEAQGIIDATFIGGAASYISNTTGARIVTYIPHKGNIELLCDRIDAWVDLQYTNNSDKLVSLIYYNYPPGKQNIGSSYLDTITSIYNMLYTLESAGYDVGELPSNVSELEDLMLKCGINVATWAPGELEKLANQTNVVLLPVSEYNDWFNTLPEIVKIQVKEGPIPYIGELARRAVELRYNSTIGETINDWYNQIVALLPENKSVEATRILDEIVSSLKNYTATYDEEYYNLFQGYYEEFKELDVEGLTGWGDCPGNVMVVNKNSTDYFVIPGIKFGNVYIAPEPQRGWESDIENLYHCTAVAPTHQYLAAYYYMQTYYPNGMVFVGRHATHEWLPGKEILLSSTDYGSIVVGKTPQLYFYISDGLGEAIQAKRRGFAVILSHLTSPLSYTQLYGNLTVAANLIEEYLNSNDQALKDEISEEIRNLIIDNDYSMNLGLNKEDVKAISSDELLSKVNVFLKSTQSTIYPLGLHAIGQYWNENDLASTVSVMMSFDFDMKNNKGETNLFKELSKVYFNSDYANLTPLQRETILNKSYEICDALIYWDAETVQYVLIESNNAFNNSNFTACLNLAKEYINLINGSIQAELDAMLDGLNGKYIPISEGGEIIAKPYIMPTGRNMFQDQSCELPTIEAYDYAKILALLTLSDLNDTTEKIIMGIWCVETARDDGALVSTVLYLLGMKPVWTDSPSAGIDTNHDHDDESTSGKKVKNMPVYLTLEDLERPEGWAKKRIDVTVITSGLFRDLYSSQTILLDNAFRVALARSYLTITSNETLMNSEYGPQVKEAIDYIMEGIGYYGVSGAMRESLDDNYVAKHWLEDCLYYLSIGYNATYAGECAITRIFAPPNGDYGAGISKLVSMSWTWNSTEELADFYLGRMGNMYSKNYWGDTNPLVFLRALSNSDTIVASRNTNQYGVLDNDDFFDYWGGLSMTVEQISGKAPKFNVLMYANRDNAYISSLEEVMYQEIAARYDNPEWIKGMMNEGYSGARYISNKFVSNLFGWQVTRPSAVSDDLWNRIYDTYYNDKYNLGVKEWLESGNNAYSLISMSGTMLTSIKEGYWNADEGTIRNIANTWAQATVQNGVACCDCSCGNIAMMQWAVQYVNPDILAQLLPKLYDATRNPVFLNNSQNVPPQDEDSSNTEASSPNPVEGSTSQATIASNSTTNTESHSQSSESSNHNSGSSNGQSASNVGANDQSGNPQGQSASDAGDSSETGESDSYPSEGADVKKAVEINPITAQSASEVGLSIIAVLGVLCLIGVIALGYFRNRDDGEEIKDLDELYNEKII